jgi:transcriptional regulator with XRE-family HTH domain
VDPRLSFSPARLKLHRMQAGMSQSALAAKLRELTGTATVTANYVYRWETGRRTPDDWLVALALALALGVEVGDLCEPVLSAASPFQHQPPRWEETGGVRRRELLLHDFESLSSEDPTRIVSQARAVTASNVDHHVLGITRHSIEQVVMTYEQLGPWPLAMKMRSLRDTLHNLLEGRQSLAQRQELFQLAGRVAGLLAYMAINIGRPVLAEADAAAAAAVALAPSSPQAIRPLINGRSRALARMGSMSEAERAIGEALSISDQADELPEGMSSCVSFAPYSPARTMANAVTAFLSLGKTGQVLSHARQLEDLVEGSDSRWSKALVRLDVASALLTGRSPEVDEAMALGCKALETTSTTPIRSVERRARELALQAAPWRETTEVTGYRHRLHRWRAHPLARTLDDTSQGNPR